MRMERLNIAKRDWGVVDHAPLGKNVCSFAVQLRHQTLGLPAKLSILMMLMLAVPSFAARGQKVSAGPGQAVATPSAALIISGVVLDPSKAAIAGAKVTLRGVRIVGQLSATTDAGGYFQFGGVASGSYEIEVQQENFEMFRTRVEVRPSMPATLRITLSLAELHEEITVTEPQRHVSDEAGENADVIRLEGETLDSLPIMDNDVVSAVREMLGPGSGNATVMVDGLMTTGVDVRASAIQEVRINQNPYSAEFSGPGQKRIEITTKKGSSAYHGSFNATFRSYHLDARNAFATNRPPEHLLLFDGYLSGPLGSGKKTTFDLNVNRRQDDLQSIVFARVPSGTLVQSFPNPQRSTYYLAGLNRQTSERSTFSIRYSFFDWSDNGIGVGGISLPETASDESSHRQYLDLSGRELITPRLVNEFYGRMTTSHTVTRGVLQGQPSIVVLGTFIGGGSTLDYEQSHDNFQITDMMSWSHGKHLVKGGINLPELSHSNSDDRTDVNGTFRFSSLQDYQQGRPFSFVEQEGNSQLLYWQKELGLFVQDEARVHRNLSIAIGLRYDWQNYIRDRKNFAPRFSFAFAPGKARKIVLRGGVGIFYETTGSEAIADMLRFNGRTLRQIVLSNPSYPDPFSPGGSAQSLPSSVVRFSPDLRLPYNVQYSFGAEAQLQKATTFTATYIGSHGFSLFRSRDINAPLPPLYIQRPDPTIGALREIESAGSSESDTLKFAIQTKIGHLFEGMVQYTFGRSYDDTSGIDAFPANQYDLTGEWSRSDDDSRHFLYLYGTMNAPRNFTLGVSLSAYSGRPYTMTTGIDEFGTTFANARPPGIPRNSLQGPGFCELNLRLAKTFHVLKLKTGKDKKDRRQGPSAMVALDGFNLLNHVNFGRPVGNLSSPFFEHSISAGPPRRLQVSLAFQF